MKCPYCNKEIPGVMCPGCSETIPEDSRYCLYCGAVVKDTSEEDNSLFNAGETDDFDFEDRIPCSDGNCIGIILDGKCNICGKRYKGKKRS
jgi:hypothetical protein